MRQTFLPRPVLWELHSTCRLNSVGGETPDIRSDIYSLGITAFEMLVGTPPFQGSVPQLYQMHMNEPLPDFPSHLNIPPALEAIIRKCMEKDPGDRYQTASELGIALETLSGKAHSSDARGAAQMGQASSDEEDETPSGNNWRRQGRYTVLGEIGKDDRQGFRRSVQAGADEVVIVRKSGKITDVFSEGRKPTRSFGEALASIFTFGPNTEIYKATKTRFNIVF